MTIRLGAIRCDRSHGESGKDRRDTLHALLALKVHRPGHRL